MSETSLPICAKCGKTVEPDSRFCKYCAFDLTSSPATENVTSKPQTKDQRILFVLIGVGVLVIALVVVIGVTFVGLYVSSQSNTANTSVSETNRQSTQIFPSHPSHPRRHEPT